MKRRIEFRSSWVMIKGQRTFWDCIANRVDNPINRTGVLCGSAIIPSPITMKRMLEQNSAFVCEFLIDRRAEDK